MTEIDDPDAPSNTDGIIALVAVMVLLVTVAILIKVFLA